MERLERWSSGDLGDGELESWEIWESWEMENWESWKRWRDRERERFEDGRGEKRVVIYRQSRTTRRKTLSQ